MTEVLIGTTTTYRKGVILEGLDYDKFNRETQKVSEAIAKAADNPWTRVVSMQTVVTLVVEPDPNLTEDFWISVATGRKYIVPGKNFINSFMEHCFG